MAQDLIHYDRLIEAALRGVVRDVLTRTAGSGRRRSCPAPLPLMIGSRARASAPRAQVHSPAGGLALPSVKYRAENCRTDRSAENRSRSGGPPRLV